MRICQDHAHELKNAIRQRGLWRLVMDNGPTAAHRPPEGTPTFDPLLAVDLLIVEQALRALGVYLLRDRHCPLCEVERNLGEGQASEWIDVDADIVLHVCRERNLIGRE